MTKIQMKSHRYRTLILKQKEWDSHKKLWPRYSREAEYFSSINSHQWVNPTPRTNFSVNKNDFSPIFFSKNHIMIKWGCKKEEIKKTLVHKETKVQHTIKRLDVDAINNAMVPATIFPASGFAWKLKQYVYISMHYMLKFHAQR